MRQPPTARRIAPCESPLSPAPRTGPSEAVWPEAGGGPENARKGHAHLRTTPIACRSRQLSTEWRVRLRRMRPADCRPDAGHAQ